MIKAGIPKVTVLMPVYNGELYLRAAIESILRQSFDDFEYLILDDGSTDGSQNIIKSFNDPRIKFLRRESNLGIEATLNEGLCESKGEYIARMDCDDVSLPTRLGKQVKFLEQQTEITGCGSWVEAFGVVNRRISYPLDHDDIFASLLFYNALPHPCMMLRRRVLIDNKYFYSTEFPGAEDYELWSRISKNHRLSNIPEVLYQYRQYPGQISRLKHVQKIDSACRIRRQFIDDLGLQVSDDDLRIHCSISQGEQVCSLEFLKAADSWLRKIAHANVYQQIYNESSLQKVLGRYWWQSCLKTTSLGMSVWLKFYRSPLCHDINLSYNEKMKFLAKCLVHK